MVAPLEPRDRPFHERAEAVELERVQAGPVFDQAVGRDTWVVLIVVQSEGTGHLCETNTERQADVSRLNAGNVSIKPTQGPSGCRGIPRELVRRWSEQHRRRNETIRKLETYQV